MDTKILYILSFFAILFLFFHVKSDFEKQSISLTNISDTVSSTDSKKILEEEEEEEEGIEEAILKRVVDGDTIIVTMDGFEQRVRVIGLNTPEVHEQNGRVRECFGKEASEYAKKILKEKDQIYLQKDPTQDAYDQYGRMLAHVFYSSSESVLGNIENDLRKDEDRSISTIKNFAQEMISQGYAYEYTYRLPYLYQKEYKEAQKEAEELKRGLWGEDACKG